MILYKCDRCGKLMKTPMDNFTITFTPPEFRKFGGIALLGLMLIYVVWKEL